MRVRALLVVLLVVGMTAAADNDPIDKPLVLLQGKYRILKAVKNGVPMAEKKVASAEVLIEGRVFLISESGINAKERKESMTFKIDASKKPHTIDLMSFDPAVKKGDPKVARGIYKVDGKRLTIAVREGDERPKEFASPKGSQITLLELERKN